MRHDHAYSCHHGSRSPSFLRALSVGMGLSASAVAQVAPPKAAELRAGRQQFSRQRCVMLLDCDKLQP